MMFAVIGMIVLYEIFSYNSAPASSHVYSSIFGGITSFLLDVLMHPGLFLLGFVGLFLFQAFCAVNVMDSCTGLRRFLKRGQKRLGLGKKALTWDEIDVDGDDALEKSTRKRGIKEMKGRGDLQRKNAEDAENARNKMLINMKPSEGEFPVNGKNIKINSFYKSGLANLAVKAGGILTSSNADLMNDVLSGSEFAGEADLQTMLNKIQERAKQFGRIDDGSKADLQRIDIAHANIAKFQEDLKYYSDEEKENIKEAIRTRCIERASTTAYLTGTVSGDSIQSAIKSVGSDLQAGKTTTEILRDNPGKCIEISKYLKLKKVTNGATARNWFGKTPSADLVQELRGIDRDLLTTLQKLPSGTTLSNYAGKLKGDGVKIDEDFVEEIGKQIAKAEEATLKEVQSMSDETTELDKLENKTEEEAGKAVDLDV